MRAKWYQGIVTDIQHISNSKMTFSMKVDDEEVFQFEGGQFITMDLPLGDKRLQRWRSYSIANIPNDENILDFGIGHFENGLASTYFFEQLSIGDSIKFKGPEGAFILPENLEQQIVMIATGTGVVPFVSMIRQLIQNKIPFEGIHLIYGTRYIQDILYRNELEEYANTYDNIQLDLVLSREQEWSGHQGYVHNVYQNAYPIKNEDIQFLICGWSSMIDEAMVNLFSKVASPPKQIKYELYG